MSIFDENYELNEVEEDELNGFEVYDENEVYRRKKAESEQAEEDITIASPIPENEQKVIVDDADFFGIPIGERLNLELDEGLVKFNGKKVAKLKSAFIVKLKEKRAGFYVKTTLYTLDPPMLKLEFTTAPTQEFNVKI